MTINLTSKGSKWWVYFVDPAERAGKSFIQEFGVLLLPLLMVGGKYANFISLPWLSILLSSLGAAVVSIFLSIVTSPVPKLSPYADFAVRLIRTFVGSLVGTLGASLVADGIVHAPWQSALGVAIDVTLAAAVTGIAALALPGTDGASLLPKTRLTNARASARSTGSLLDHDALQARQAGQNGPATPA
jgi:hypothetical protein